MPLDLRHAASQEDAWNLPQDLYSCWEARGSYSPLEFVLRLRPDIHNALNAAPTGLVSVKELTGVQLSAFSTYLHENIHWWQHVGSTSGLMLSLLYPAQTHINRKYLDVILAELGPKKPIRGYNLLTARPRQEETELDRQINVVLNNWHDIEFYRWLIIDPGAIESHIDDPYFECVGHSYVVALGAVINLISSTIDPQLEILPDPRKWDEKFSALKRDKSIGFYYGSPIMRSPIGAKEIFEGQARFNQLQYLYFAAGAKANWSDFETGGMFKGIYIAAFDFFIKITGFERPIEMDDSVIGLFLLVCDISINPVEGFVLAPENHAKLVEDHDPGIRFFRLCEAIRHNRSEFNSAVCEYSATEYWSLTDSLCELVGFLSPRDLMATVGSWSEGHQAVKDLMVEDKTFNFPPGNLPVRLFLSRFIQFQLDKSKNPEFFCWPGVWMTTGRKGKITTQLALALFEEHRALFLDREDGDVYPRTFMNREESAVQETFDTFYSWVTIYQLTRQWIVGTGEFDCRFSWLTSKFTDAEIKSWAAGYFEQFFGAHPDSFEVIA